MIALDKRQAPKTWLTQIIRNTVPHLVCLVEQNLVGAVLEKRFTGLQINKALFPFSDQETLRNGCFAVSKLVYRVTDTVSTDLIQACAEDIEAGMHPILLLPDEQKNRANLYAQEQGIDQELTVISIGDYFAFNVVAFAAEENKDFFTVLQEIVAIYNRRLIEVETDLSLKIEVR